jgi:hypothetical protein
VLVVSSSHWWQQNKGYILNKRSKEMSNVKIARKKPIEIEVIQITGGDKKIEEINDFCGPKQVSRLQGL